MNDNETTPSAPEPAGTAAPAQEAAATLNAEFLLQELEAKHAEVADAYLRAKAEAENTRRDRRASCRERV